MKLSLSALAAVLLVALPTGAVRAQSRSAATAVRERHAQLRARWIAQANEIAEECAIKGQEPEAEAIRALIRPEPSPGISITVLPANGSAPDADGSASGRSSVPAALERARKQYAKELFDLAAAAFRAGDLSYCYDLAREVIEHDPNHGPARNLLGFTRYRDQWVTPYAAAKLNSGHVWDSRFGWIPKTHVAHFDRGERLWKGQWLPADDVAARRREWSNAWEIETEHYLIRTNVSQERGVAFAEKLEKLYAVFFRLFAGFFSPRDQLAVLFDARNRRTPFGKLEDSERRQPKRFRVNFYAAQDQYLEALRPHIKSGIEGTTGIYVPATRTAYFYVHEEMDEATVIHEATHQLFSETRNHQQAIGTRGNHWVIEGIACYMESLEDHGDRVELGGWDTPRLEIGRQRILAGSYLPIDKLIRLEMSHFQGPAVYALYSESACLCRFLMHYDHGLYRDALVRYLEDVYMGRADYRTLADLTGVDYSRLDEQFRAHVAAGED